MIKRILTAAALATVLAAPAFAQQPMGKPDTIKVDAVKPDAIMKPDTMTQSSTSGLGQPGFVQDQTATDWRGSKLIGASVYGPDNASIGEINDVLIGKDGGDQRRGGRRRRLPRRRREECRHPVRDAHSRSASRTRARSSKITVSYTKDELKNAPKFAYYKAASRRPPVRGGR